MGGNAVIGDYRASRIDLSVVERKVSIAIIKEFLDDLNSCFIEYSGANLWSNSLLNTLEVFSGSSRHFMDKNISDEFFISIKPTIGDIDIQVDKNDSELLDSFFELNIGANVGDFQLLGLKKSAGQTITLWKNIFIGIIQIDFEFVDFENDFPSDWAQFSRSSPIEDFELGLRGVFHKYALRALTAKTLGPKFIIKNGIKKAEIASENAFSVHYGLRKKLNKISLNEYELISVEDSIYTTDISEIFLMIFGFKSLACEPYLYSFDGILHLVKTIFNPDEQVKFFNGFIHTLWGKGAQKLFRDDPLKDAKEKEIAYLFMSNKLGLSIDRKILEEYYLDY